MNALDHGLPPGAVSTEAATVAIPTTLDANTSAMFSDMIDTLDRLTEQANRQIPATHAYDASRQQGYSEAIEDAAWALGYRGESWLAQLRAASMRPLSDRAWQAVKFDTDLEASFESRRPTPSELAAAVRAIDYNILEEPERFEGSYQDDGI